MMEVETGVIELQVKEHQGLMAVTRNKLGGDKARSPKSPRGVNKALLTP